MPASRILITAALLGLNALTLTAQDANAAAQQRARASLPGASATAFDAIVASARARGLPIEPLVDKVLEGSAKRVPPDRIVAVVRARAELMAKARDLSGRTGNDIVIVADALQRGVPDQVVSHMRGGAKPNEPFGLALHTYADLVQAGLSADAALDILATWRSRGAHANELRELPAAIERLIREGLPPGRAASAVAATLKSGKAASAARVDAATGRATAPGQIKIDKPLNNPKGTPRKKN